MIAAGWLRARPPPRGASTELTLRLLVAHDLSAAKAIQARPMFFQMEAIMSLGTILLIILILILIGALPTWPYSSGWAYYPSGGLASWSSSC